MSKPVKIAVIGAGSRGFAYADYALRHPDLARVVAVAEPRRYYREKMAAEHNISANNIFTCYQDMTSTDKIADAVLICTQDNMHIEPAMMFAEKGYHILLEKPMATSKEECVKIVEAVKKSDVIFGVCHVLRYTKYTQKLKQIIDSGVIGDIVNIQHLEPVGFWHYAHSYVRGNWRNEQQSSCMLLAKSCHDLDWLRYIVNSSCTSVSSYGSLRHFTAGNKPSGASDRCIDCKVEVGCPYSAKKIYIERAKRGEFGWPVDVITDELTVQGVEKALFEGPYGRCVYSCDNDVVDSQVVNMQFANGSTASFIMTAFAEMADRKTRIFGTRGEIYGDGSSIEHYDFLTGQKQKHEVFASDGGISTGHGGGDYELMKTFIKAVANQDRSLLLTGPDETLETHLSVFAAEQARKSNTVINLGKIRG